jgi:hypothetical protein
MTAPDLQRRVDVERSRKSTYVASMFLLVGLVALVGSPGTAEGQRKDERAIKKQMSQWAREIGVKCDYCHVREGRDFDYEAETPMKETAAYCKENFIDVLKDGRGREISCQDCHNRQAKFLPGREVGLKAGDGEGEGEDEDEDDQKRRR